MAETPFFSTWKRQKFFLGNKYPKKDFLYVIFAILVRIVFYFMSKINSMAFCAGQIRKFCQNFKGILSSLSVCAEKKIFSQRNLDENVSSQVLLRLAGVFNFSTSLRRLEKKFFCQVLDCSSGTW